MISVCIATHNGEKYIKEQLDSILCQLKLDDEIVISDDGSTDNTLKVIESLNDNRIKILHYKHPRKYKNGNIYAAHNFENALMEAQGEYIFLSDQDDVWCPNKVSVCLKELENSDLVIHNLQSTDSNLREMGLHFKDGFEKKNFLFKENGYHGCAMAFHRSVLSYSLPFPVSLPLHDHWIGLLTELIGNVKYIDEPLMLYRIHGDNVSRFTSNSLYYKISYRLYISFCLCIRLIKYKIKGK